jgi:protein phosphatase
MGGYAGGQVASSLAVETLRQAFELSAFSGELRAEKPIPRRGRELASSILQANWAVFEAARSAPKLSKMGTTLVATRFSPNKQRVYIGHVGDSRCYRFRAGKLRQLTTDQTLGLIGLQGPRAGDLLQAIGVTADLAIDLIVDKPLANDIYLLCSDGLPKMASDQEIQELLRSERDLEAAVYGLIELANDRGGKDNVTVVLIKVIERVVKTVPISAQELRKKGWSKLPNFAVAGSVGCDDETVVGSLPFDEPTTIGVVPGKDRKGTGRAS